MFRNLEAELVRRNLSRSDLALAIGKSYGTVSQKMCGRIPFTLNEARKIKEVFFPDCNIEYLFSEEEPRVGRPLATAD